MNRLPLIEKIRFLETNLGDRWTHTTLEPFQFDSSDVIQIQGAAKKISEHLGLPPLTFLISYAQQNANVGGHINLNDSKDVIIEIDSKFKTNYNIVLAVLAHEICHKYLHLNNLKLFPELENEMLTDATTIFTGLGKLSLNGCETTSTKVGYMNRQQFAFVYRLVCQMRRIPESERSKGLTFDAMIAVGGPADNYFNEQHFTNDFALNQISEAIKNEIGDSQKSFARFKKDIRVIQESVLPTANSLYKEFHSYTKSKTDALHSEANKSFNKETLNYIKNVAVFEELRFLKGKISEREKDMKKIADEFSKFINLITDNYPKQFEKQNLEFLFQFACPTCGSKMRINQKKLARVKCSNCNYSFIIDTGVEKVITKEPETNAGLETSEDKKTNGVVEQNHTGLWTKVKSFFR